MEAHAEAALAEAALAEAALAAPVVAVLAEVRVREASEAVITIVRPTSTVPISVGDGDGVVLAVISAEAEVASAQ